MSYKLVLFDIDGTLIDSGKVGSLSLRKTFFTLYGIKDVLQNFFLDGKTDPQIIKELLKNYNIDKNQLPKYNYQPKILYNGKSFSNQVNFLLSIYLTFLNEEATQNKSGYIKPGITEILETLSKKENIILALLTGNIEQGAKIKLEMFDLNKYFKFGAFGSDSEKREELVPIVKRRACNLFNTDITEKNIFVIGDSVRDIWCAKPHGVISVAVATGMTPYEELEKEKPNYLFHDLSDIKKFMDILL